MRIGIDCRLWRGSGVGRYIRNLVKELQVIDKKNEYVLFVLSKDKEEILKQVQNDNPDNFRTARVDIRWHTIEEQIKFPFILNKENLDLVHFPCFSAPIFYHKPFIVTIHDLILHHFSTGEALTLPLPIYQFKLAGYKIVISQTAKKAKKIITVSNATKREIVDHLEVPEGKIVVTYESVDDRLSSNLPTSLKLRGASKIKNYFLYVGNAYPHKNLERLLQAFSLVCHPERSEGSKFFGLRPPNDIHMVLVGKEDYFYKRLKEKVKKMGLFGSVIFHGEATDEELTILYKNARALIVPSLMEGFGLPVLEAMANKCLVLCSDIPALKEVCGDAAIYFNPYDTSEMARRLEDAINKSNSSVYQTKISKGVERAKMFSWKKMAQDTLKIYESSACV